jgi:excisionase family DNA binding protein
MPTDRASRVRTMSSVELHLDDGDLERLAALVAQRLDGRGPEPWVGVPEAAAHLACQPQRIYNLVHARAIPHRKDGSRLLFKRSELDRWLDGRADV